MWARGIRGGRVIGKQRGVGPIFVGGRLSWIVEITPADHQQNNHQQDGKKYAKHNVNEIENASRIRAKPEQGHTRVRRLTQITAVALKSERLLKQQNGYEHVGGRQPNADHYGDARAEFAHTIPARIQIDGPVQTHEYYWVGEYKVKYAEQVHLGFAPVGGIYEPVGVRVGVWYTPDYREYDYVEQIGAYDATCEQVNGFVAKTVGAYDL